MASTDAEVKKYNSNYTKQWYIINERSASFHAPFTFFDHLETVFNVSSASGRLQVSAPSQTPSRHILRAQQLAQARQHQPRPQN